MSGQVPAPGDRGQAGPTPAAAGPRRLFLANGLEVLLLPDPASRLVTSIVVIGAGANREDPRLSGASHFLEHMLFNGTDRRTQKELYDAQDDAGGFNNAMTRRTHAAFMMTMPVHELDLALDLQADMLFHSRLPTAKFEKERGIILEELAKDRESPTFELERLLQRETYPASSYGLPVLGTEQSISVLRRDEVYGYYKRLYVPENMCAVLLGGFDPEAALQALERTFGAAPPAGLRPQAPAPPAPPAADRIIRHQMVLDHARLRMVWDAVAPQDPHFLAATAAADLLLGGTSSPLAQALDERFPGAVVRLNGGIEAGSGFGRLVLDIDLAAGRSLEEVADAVRELLPRLPPPPADRLAGWKVSQRAQQVFARQRSYMFAPVYSAEIALQGLWRLENRLQRLAELSRADLLDAMQRMAQGPVWIFLVEAVADGDARTPEGAAVDVEVEESPSTPYEIDRTVLENGAHLLRVGAPEDGSLAVYVLIEGRNYLEPEGLEGITELLHHLLAGGAGDLDEAAFQAALEEIGAELQTADIAFIPYDDYYSDAEFSFIRFQALAEQAPRAFDLLGEMLREPRWDGAVLERERSRMLAGLRRKEGAASTWGERELLRLLLPEGHPAARTPFGSAAGVAAITMEDLKAYHARLLDPRRVWIAVVSNEPLGTVRGWANRLLPAASAPAPSPTLGMTAERFALWQEREQLGAQLEQAFARHRATGGRVAAGGSRGYVLEALLLPEKPAFRAPDPTPGGPADEVWRIAAGVLSSRLAFDLREQQGMAYGIGASLQKLGGRTLYVAAAGTRQENLPAMAEGFRRVRQAAAHTVSAEETRRTASKIYGRTLRRQEVRLNQAMFSVWSARAGADPRAWWTQADQLRQVPEEEVRAAVDALANMTQSLVVIVD